MKNDSEMILENVIYVLFRRKWLILFSFCFVLSTMIFFIWLITPTYRAMNRVLIHQNYKMELGLFEDLETAVQLNPRINWGLNIQEMAKSNVIAEEIVKRFGLEERYRQKVESPESSREKIKAFIGELIEWPSIKLDEWGLVEKKPKDYLAEEVEEFTADAEDIELVEDTEILEIGIYEESPDLANQIVDAITTRLLEKAVQLDQQNAEKSYQFADAELEKAEEGYINAREAMEEFKHIWQVTSFDDEKKIKLDLLSRIKEDYSQVCIDLAGNRAERKDINLRLQEDKLSYNDYELKNRLRDLELMIATLEGRKHQLIETMDDLNKDIDQLILRENKYINLDKDVELKEEFYSNLLIKRNELLVQKGTEIGEFSIRLIDSFKVSPYADPDWPDLKIFLPISLLFSLGISLAVPFLLEFFLKYPRKPEQLQEGTGVPVLGVIPVSPSKKTLRKSSSTGLGMDSGRIAPME